MLTEDFYIEFKKTHTKAYFSFPDIAPVGAFTFEKLINRNFDRLFLLFECDTSLFVDERFKTREGAKEYARFNFACGAYLPKHGCQDWLFKWDNEYAGILHLYDLSLETFGQNNKRVWIGFSTTEKFRNKGISFQVVSYFIQYIFESYHAIDFIHAMTLSENRVAKSFLTKCDFVPDMEERGGKEYAFFIRRRAGRS